MNENDKKPQLKRIMAAAKLAHSAHTYVSSFHVPEQTEVEVERPWSKSHNHQDGGGQVE